MLKAIQGGLTLAVLIIVLKWFLPEIAAGLIVLTLKVIAILNVGIDHAAASLPR